MADDSGVNKEYKDRLFNFIFGLEENKAWTLSLYNAVNGSSYTNPDDMILKLSDSFPEGSESDIEAKVRMINVNYGRSKQTIDACKPLYEYSWLIQTIRDYKKTINEIEKAVDKAITDMPDDYILKQFLVTHRAEVNGMLVTEYNEEETMELFKEDGRKEGRKEGSRIMIYELVADGDITKKKGAQKLGITIEELKNNMELTGYKCPS